MIERYKLLLDGEWTLADLDYLGRSLNVAYSYLFWMTAPDDHIPPYVREAFARNLWSREYVNETFPHLLLARIPYEEQARIYSIKYSSPGWIEIAAAASALTALALCVRAWLTTADRALDTLQRLHAFLKKYGFIGRSQRTELDDVVVTSIKEAEKLCKEAAPALGIAPRELAKILELTGNPISALRLMVALAKSSQRLADLQNSGKLKLPKT